MNILLTGSNGFLGRNLLRFLSKKNYLIDTYCRTNSYMKIIKSTKKYDLIIHAASATPENTSDNLILKSNILMTSNLCNIALHSECKYFLNISSVSVYGRPTINKLLINSPLSATDSYGYSKILCEEIINYNLGSISKIYHLRLPGIVGRGSYEASKNFISKILHNFKNNLEINLHSPESLFNNITSDYSIYKCIEHILFNEVPSGAYLIASKKTLLLKEIINFLKYQTLSNSEINWLAPPKNHYPFVIDISKSTKYNLPLRDTLDELKYFIKELT